MPPSGPAELYVRASGEGRPVLLLHRIGGDHAVWNGVIPALAADRRVVAPDLRGHGRSVLPDGSTMSTAEIAADVAALVEREPAGPVDLVGISGGGFVALTLAAAAPERIGSVTLISSADHCDAHTRSIGARWAEIQRSEGTDALALRMLKDLYYPDWIEAHLEVADQLREALEGRDLTAMLRWAEAVGSFDLRGRLGAFRTPTLVVQGMDDRIVDPSHARMLRQTIRGAEVRLLAQTGHMVPVERPSETAAAIRTFLGRTGPAAPH